MKTKVILSILFFTSTVFSGYKYETILDNLDDAWSIVFLKRRQSFIYGNAWKTKNCLFIR